MPSSLIRQRLLSPAAFTVYALAVVVAWDATRLDLPLAGWMAGPQGFALRHHGFLTEVLHDGARRLAWLLAVALCLAVWWPPRALARVPQPDRLQLAAVTLASAFLVTTLKGLSATSCPWDLAQFGGVAHYVRGIDQPRCQILERQGRHQRLVRHHGAVIQNHSPPSPVDPCC